MAQRLRSLSIFGMYVATTTLLGCSSTGGSSFLATGNSSAGTGANGNSTNNGTGNGSSVNPSAGGTSSIFSGSGGAAGNPCLGAQPPASCQLVASGPACGDGELNQESEACDDGNSIPGDGCTGICTIEPNHECVTPGQLCKSILRCGNGVIEPGEVCDDGNTTADDGCSADCTVLSASFICPAAGKPCTRVEFCGNGRIKGDENCDDGNTNAADGCDATCHQETGWLCPVPGKPCKRVAVCGDGTQSTELGEKCDDGNTASGDGCSADCKATEAGFECPTPGKKCLNLNACGDGRVTFAETCDDANTDPNDGCDNCQVQKGYDCPYPGAKCIGKCGDKVVISYEACDDGNTKDGDGCSSVCTWEKGWACTGNPGAYSCHKTSCGDGTAEGTEGCEDGNNDLGDGCTPLCQIEPGCASGACKSACGDGLVLTSSKEQCDDGNTRSGDGCSSTCQVETGYQCKQPALGDSMAVPVVYRDFNKGGEFEPGVNGSNDPTKGMVQATLDAKGKPVYVGPNDKNKITAASFANWYKDASGTNSSHPGELKLWNNGSGAYVNRWGPNGEQWTSTTEQWCGEIGKEVPDAAGKAQPCTFCSWDDPLTTDIACDQQQPTPCQTDAANFLECKTNGNVWNGVFLSKRFDGNPVFFPVDEVAGHITPTADYVTALVPTAYAGNWAAERGGKAHNFHFTSEVRYWFMFSKSQTFTLDFLGDDDVWVFINRKIAVDLGGIHTPISGRIVIGADGNGTTTITPSEGTTKATTQSVNLGLQDGQVYEIAVFQAERQTAGSSYKLTLSGFNAAASVCGPICGDGELAPGEQCDDGTNEGGYGKCQPGCIRGPYCGDKIINGPETCDNGTNLSAYNTDNSGCAPGCAIPARCGDAEVQPAFGETCDDGKNDGVYGGCTSSCQFAPRCGDGQLNGNADHPEQCDDGANDGSYGNCGPGCVLGPRCGDNVLSEEFGEQCEDGNTSNGDGCSSNCRFEGVCGDTIVDSTTGEECDDGVNDGGYGECGPNCKLGPRCGDSVTQSPPEQCDGGPNPTGGYGECAKGCVLGPHCGDGNLQSGYEECDDGNQNSKDGCSAACMLETPQIL